MFIHFRILQYVKKMKKIAVTGLSGVIGSILAKELVKNRKIIDLYHLKKHTNLNGIKIHMPIDLAKKNSVSNALSETGPDIIVHLAAITHIDECEKDRTNGKSGKVWKTNVEGTREIAKYAAQNNVPLVFLSTECVFDGSKEFFEEKSMKEPINWYGVTKSKAEDAILKSGAKAAIVRSVVTYYKNRNAKTIYGKILHELQTKRKTSGVVDVLFTPTHTHDIVKAITTIIDKKLVGIYHVAPKKSISPYDFAKLVAKANDISEDNVKKITLAKLYGKDRALLRLTHSSLSGEETVKKLNFVPRSPNAALTNKKGSRSTNAS